MKGDPTVYIQYIMESITLIQQ